MTWSFIFGRRIIPGYESAATSNIDLDFVSGRNRTRLRHPFSFLPLALERWGKIQASLRQAPSLEAARALPVTECAHLQSALARAKSLAERSRPTWDRLNVLASAEQERSKRCPRVNAATVVF
jgi:hypothetical protein